MLCLLHPPFQENTLNKCLFFTIAIHYIFANTAFTPDQRNTNRSNTYSHTGSRPIKISWRHINTGGGNSIDFGRYVTLLLARDDTSA